MTIALFAVIFHLPLIIHNVEGLLEIKNNDVEITYNVKFFNHCQDDTYRLEIFHRGTLAGCVTECGLRSHCKALNYHAGMALCKLFTEADSDYKENGCIHVRQDDIHIHKSPCGKTCSFGLTCDISTRNCTVKECINFPTLNNGTVLGNRKEVRTYIKTMCDNNYGHKNGIKQSYCTENGHWNPVVECIKDCGPSPATNGATFELNEGTLEGSVALYTCQSNFVHVGGALTRVCQADGEWNETGPQCNRKTCTSNGLCFVLYPQVDLPGYDINYHRTSSFEECSSTCQATAPTFRSIEHCPYRFGRLNCFCKHVSVQEGYTLRRLDDCDYYDRM